MNLQQLLFKLYSNLNNGVTVSNAINFSKAIAAAIVAIVAVIVVIVRVVVFTAEKFTVAFGWQP